MSDISPTYPRVFALRRKKDKKHISGEGWVLYGVLFRTGVTVVEWTTTEAMGVFPSFDKFMEVHVRTWGKRPDDSEIVWLN